MTVPRRHVAIVVDVGGTATRLALAEDGRLTDTIVRVPTPSPRIGVADPVGQLLDLIAEQSDRLREALPDRHVDAIGVAFGAVVTNAGVVRNASTLWLAPSTGLDVAAALRDRLPWAPVTVVNDVAAAPWHYRELGRFLYATVSTGIAIKAFDAGLPGARKVLLDPEWLGGESGHTIVDPTALDAVPGGAAAAVRLGRAAAGGDPDARADLDRLGLPWCECGAVGDLCAYASGPGTIRVAAAEARRLPESFAGSVLAELTGSDPDRIDGAALARAAARGDAFTATVLHRVTRPLAARLLQLCADLGLDRAVIAGGFAHGVGAPWFDALRANVDELMVDAGWFTGWTAEQRAGLLVRPPDTGDAPLGGMAALLAEGHRRYLSLVKPVGDGGLVVHEREVPGCGREQFQLRMRYAGICGTDLRILRGDVGCEPEIPGHECVAEVVAVGDSITGLTVGQVVTLNPNNPLDDSDKLGHNRPGTFTQLLTLDHGVLSRGQVVDVPEIAGPEWVLVEPLAAALRANRATTEFVPGERVLVVGGGLSGLMLAGLARLRGAATVLLASRTPATVERAVQLGFCSPEHGLPLNDELGSAVLAATGGFGVDAVYVAVGSNAGTATVATLWPALAKTAAVNLYGGFPADSRLPVGDGDVIAVGPLRSAAAHQWVDNPAGGKVVVLGNRGGRREHLLAAVELFRGAGSELGLDRLVTHIVSLPAAPRVAAELARHGTVDGRPALRVVIDPWLPGTVVRVC
ncbi:ROK family protein [Plantactinospora sp. S1510]|uniref:ROK family protein n=1 Tax=Plantactinospora alkalitolerans TaxID=2789879 RepID=A0ABS0GTZ9_9ACTN|nr:ROK family protein [Plantactinospora alkalitolerans]MBF9129660.1 ROK family protein [Plantactinospora alkalitolerans]